MLKALLLTLLASVAACGGGKSGKLMVDTPILPYVPPDTDELAGIDPDEEEEEAEEVEEDTGTEPAPAPAPTP